MTRHNIKLRQTAVTHRAQVTTETYIYDADGNHVARTRNGQTTVYVFGAWEDTISINQRKLYRFGGQVVAQRDNAGVTYLHGDHLGSASVVTDANGNLASKQEYGPWGNVRSGGASGTSLNYTGQRLDGTGLLFYNARYYDPAIGRFITRLHCHVEWRGREYN